ncbi:MAG: hypothetical protein ACRCZJ_06570 [Erysipelotrichaceae bacterium]
MGTILKIFLWIIAIQMMSSLLFYSPFLLIGFLLLYFFWISKARRRTTQSYAYGSQTTQGNSQSHTNASNSDVFDVEFTVHEVQD